MRSCPIRCGWVSAAAVRSAQLGGRVVVVVLVVAAALVLLGVAVDARPELLLDSGPVGDDPLEARSAAVVHPATATSARTATTCDSRPAARCGRRGAEVTGGTYPDRATGPESSAVGSRA